MCGIVGIVGHESDRRAEMLRRMNAALVHRGPDEEGIHEMPRAGLAMRRLSIQDVQHGHQPVFDESGQIAVVFNGEIYNVAELRHELSGLGHTIVGTGDTDLLPHLYEEYGPDFVSRLRGMFTIAVWDSRTDTLVLARDRLGKKPLYYWHHADGMSFASELKALMVDPDLPRKADVEAISHYLTFQYVPAPMSAVDGVRKLPPGHILTLDASGLNVRRYWHLDYLPEGAVDTRSEGDLVEELRERLLDSVKVRMVSERPLGAFLSGGLDSSAVVAAMSQVAPGRVKTFSIGFDEDSHNELPFAKRVAERYETEHHELVVRPDAVDLLPRLAGFFDEPFADSSAIPSFYLAEMAAEHVVVALNGDGGDEALGGYSRYTRFLRAGQRSVPRWAAKTVLSTGNRLRPLGARSTFLRKASTAAILFGESDPANRYARSLSYFRPEEKNAIFTREFRSQVVGADSYAMVRDIWQAHLGTDVANRLLAIDTHTYLPGDLLSKVDITTMSVSLEARSPFLDHTLVEWAAGIAGDRKIRDRVSKTLLKQALNGWIDDDLIHRTKMGFGVPLAAWLRGPLREMVYDNLTDSTAAGRGYFDPAAIRTLVDEHMAGVDRSSQVYALLMLELWHREVLDRTAHRVA